MFDDYPKLMGTALAAKAIGASEKTLANWRIARKRGPAFQYRGGRVVYLRDDLEAWMRGSRVETDESRQMVEVAR